MKISKKSAVSGFAAAALAGGMLFVGAGTASAAAPSFQPDPNSSGTVTFYDAAGNIQTSGSLNDAHFVGYYEASSGLDPAIDGPKVQVVSFSPVTGQTPLAWQTSNTITSNQVSTGAHPSFPGALATTTNPVLKDDAVLNGLQDQINNFPNDGVTQTLDTANVNVYEIRINASDSLKYWASDVKVDLATNTWTQVFPVVKTATSFSSISANPVNPASHASTVTLSSTLSASDGSHPAGTVTLTDGSTAIPGVNFNASTGAVSASVTPADGNHSYTFAFAPTDTATYNVTTSATLAYTVNALAPAAATTTTVSGPTTGTVGSPVTEHANVVTGVSPTALAAGTGTVQFLVDGVNSGSPVNLTATGADFAYTPADTTAHTITAKFIPANTAVYLASQDTAGVTVTATAPAYTPDPQTIDVVVPQGGLTIKTPYTPANPFHLGNMVLSDDGTQLVSTPANFGTPGAAHNADLTKPDNGVTVTDTRSGTTGWTASASVTDFTNGSKSIAGDGLSFTNVAPAYIPGNAITSITTNDITAFHSAAKSFATTTQGPGTVDIKGKLALSAPTSTLAGTYTATLTFTIV